MKTEISTKRNSTGDVSLQSVSSKLSPGFGKDLADTLEDVAEYIARLPSMTETPTSDCKRISDLKVHLRDVRDVQRALVSLSNSVQSSMSALETQFFEVFIRERYAQFPDDILTIIFEFAGFDDFRTATNISHVCRRFRTIALSIPQIWTHIHPKHEHGLSTAEASKLARRSQPAGLGLTVEMQSFDSYALENVEYLQSMMSFISTHSSRICALTLDLGTAHVAANKNKLWFTKLSLPSLKSLKINAPPSTRLEHFYKGWEVPSLRVLRGRNCFPDLPSDVLSEIKSFSFSVEEYEVQKRNRVRWTLPELDQYLGRLHSVEELKLDFDSDLFHYRTDVPPSPKPNLKTTLRSLSIQIQEHDYGSRYAANVFKLFNYEDLTSLSISLPSEALPDICALFSHLKLAGQSGSLHNLDLRIRPEYFRYGDFRDFPRNAIISSFLEKNPKLENIYIESAGDDRQMFGFSNRLAAIRLKNCQSFRKIRQNFSGPDIIYDLEEVFKRKGDSVDECLVLDGANLKTSPLDEAELLKVPISDRDVASIRATLSS
ncbi:hypothetical protein SCHPADRAFT_573252 [Schizopora paradoxa]|uniref:F-box domain-containing protein n=1 Tax=Schizopora paradoxa TaxID=27342 RepID=A0A0H2RCT6_9AGAM|nr:hypothetical protein SCHPADRAFT_573252 [Schizopora paradoxa]